VLKCPGCGQSVIPRLTTCGKYRCAEVYGWELKKPFLITSDDSIRRQWIQSNKGTKIAVYNRIPMDEINDLFSDSYSLKSLYDDRTFFDALAKVDGTVDLYFIDLGLDYCRSQSAYIKEYTKLKPLSQQAKSVQIIDHMAFYYSEKSIFRPFLYLRGDVFHETLQQFYGIGAFSDYEGNRVETYVNRVSSYIDMRQKQYELVVIESALTESERKQYEDLKYDLIMKKKKPKAPVTNRLFKFILELPSRRETIRKQQSLGNDVVENNNPRIRHETYLRVVTAKHPLVFIMTGLGIDDMALDETLETIRRHNLLVEMCRA
jgi:hypothetical protein